MKPIQHIRILLVEDDEEDADVFRRYITQVGRYSVVVTQAKTADEGRSCLAAGRFDLVFLDLKLGGRLSGLDLLREMRAAPCGPPAVVVTGAGDEEKAAETLRSGAADYLVKDRLSPELLERTIRSVREKHVFEREREQMMRKLAELSITDELTAVANRRHLMAKLEEEILRSNRSGHLFALVMIDLDRFKEVNDRYGHQIGDDVLRTCAATILGHSRATDFTARYGGDEFCVLVPDASFDGAQRVAEKLRSAIDELPDPMPSASIGVAFWRPRISRDELLRNADELLYRAKQNGRNQVAVCP